MDTALAIRLAAFRSSVAADVQAQGRVFGFFAIVAGINVLGCGSPQQVIRLSQQSWPGRQECCGSS